MEDYWEEEIAAALGIKPEEEHLMYIVKEFLEDFASTWRVCKDRNGNISHYYNEKTGEQSQEIPIDTYYIDKVEEERKKQEGMQNSPGYMQLDESQQNLLTFLEMQENIKEEQLQNMRSHSTIRIK